ncbi:MAG: hypothetical protein NC318_11665 [Blautia sp.]|nr:hypothetical protein [Blautia sp.]
MNNQSKQIVIDALIKAINAAPTLYFQRNYMYPTVNQNVDVSMQEFNTWMDYANQILDISYNHIGLNAILSTKMAMCQIASQYEISNIQRIDQIKQELIKLTQIIVKY